MLNVKDCFKNRTIGFFLSLIAACVALVAAIVYIILATGDRTFSMIGFGLTIAGVVTELLVVFTDWRFSPLVPVILLSAGAGFVLVMCLPTLMDLVNGIQFFSGNLAVAFLIPSALIVSVLLSCVSNFMDMRKV